mmetsp:Transcript_36768/g.78366  ORF Transcript_36768/g.78366 Transcript_36768/m.78366 type:complete len:83 (-) Transcript_36768:1318-1566(-)
MAMVDVQCVVWGGLASRSTSHRRGGSFEAPSRREDFGVYARQELDDANKLGSAVLGGGDDRSNVSVLETSSERGRQLWEGLR